MLRAELGTKNSPVHLFFHNQTRTAFSTASAWDAVAVAPCCCDSKALPCPHIPILQWGEKHSHHFCNIPLRQKFKINRNLMTDWKCKEELLKTKPYCTFTWQRNQSSVRSSSFTFYFSSLHPLLLLAPFLPYTLPSHWTVSIQGQMERRSSTTWWRANKMC